jgi:DNA-binding transcriptional ArsR family regulator
VEAWSLHRRSTDPPARWALRWALPIARSATTSAARTRGRCLGSRVRSPVPENEHERNVIDRLREQLQERLDQLLSEADRLRKALAALDPRSPKTSPQRSAARRTAEANRTAPAASAAKRTPAPRTAKPAARSPRRTAPGATKASVLAALAGGEPMTAGQVADKTGFARPTVSTTLSKLTKSGPGREGRARLPAAIAVREDVVPVGRVATTGSWSPLQGGATVARCSRWASSSTSTR